MVHQDGAAATSGTMWCWLVVPHVDGDGVVLNLHHSKHQPTSIVTPDNYSFCPCTRGRHKNAAMYVQKSFAFIKTAVVGAIFCGVCQHIYIKQDFPKRRLCRRAGAQQSTENLCFK